VRTEEDIVHAGMKMSEKHEQGTASGSWSWIYSNRTTSRLFSRKGGTDWSVFCASIEAQKRRMIVSSLNAICPEGKTSPWIRQKRVRRSVGALWALAERQEVRTDRPVCFEIQTGNKKIHNAPDGDHEYKRDNAPEREGAGFFLFLLICAADDEIPRGVDDKKEECERKEKRNHHLVAERRDVLKECLEGHGTIIPHRGNLALGSV